MNKIFITLSVGFAILLGGCGESVPSVPSEVREDYKKVSQINCEIEKIKGLPQKEKLAKMGKLMEIVAEMKVVGARIAKWSETLGEKEVLKVKPIIEKIVAENNKC